MTLSGRGVESQREAKASQHTYLIKVFRVLAKVFQCLAASAGVELLVQPAKLSALELLPKPSQQRGCCATPSQQVLAELLLLLLLLLPAGILSLGPLLVLPVPALPPLPLRALLRAEATSRPLSASHLALLSSLPLLSALPLLFPLCHAL